MAVRYHVKKKKIVDDLPQTVITFETTVSAREYLRDIVRSYNAARSENSPIAEMLPDGAGAVSYENSERVEYSIVKVGA